jgi:hypothetical protein
MFATQLLAYYKAPNKAGRDALNKGDVTPFPDKPKKSLPGGKDEIGLLIALS